MQYSTIEGTTTNINTALAAARSLVNLLNSETLYSDVTSLDPFNEKVTKLIEDVEAELESLKDKASKMQSIDNEVTGG